MTQSPSPTANLPQRLERAVALIEGGDLSAATTLLSAILSESPNEADALQLMGVIQDRSGRPKEAIELFQASLAISEAQPHVHNNLGSLLLTQGDFSAAEEEFRRALTLAPSYVDASYNLGLALMELKRWPEAKAALERTLILDERHARAVEALAVVLGRLGDFNGAAAAAMRAASWSPTSHTAQHNLGRAQLARGDSIAAQHAYVAAIRLKPDSDVSWLGLGHSYRHAGNSFDAIAAYRHATELNPTNYDAHRLLSEMLWQSGDTTAHLASYPVALLARPNDVRLRLGYANELLKFRQYDGARKELLVAALIAPSDGHVADAIARTEALTGDFEHAIADHRRAVDALPNEPLLQQNFIETLLKASQYDAAVDRSAQARERFPGDQGILALHTTALRLVGDARYSALADYEALPEVFEIEPPEGFDDILSFNAKLAEHLRKFHTTKNHPTDQTLRGGTQTFDALFTRPDPILGQLQQQIEKAVGAYISRMPNDSAHPLFSRKRSGFRFSGSWSSQLAREGFHTNHYHPEGWISSAYYVEIPDDVGDPDNQFGWFKMGETNLGLGDKEVVHRYVRPAVGRLVLFPSYFWHGTVPFHGNGKRLTVAFDVVPA